MNAFRRLTAALLLATPTLAWASPGWDWDEEFQSRHWRQDTLDWASDIHPDHPTDQFLLNYVDPPAEEMWCHYLENPILEDYQIHGDLMQDWLHYYLEIPLEESLPQVPMKPAECVR